MKRPVLLLLKGKQQCLEIQLGHRRPINNKGVIGKSKANSRCVQVKYCNDFDLASLFQLAALSNRCPPSLPLEFVLLISAPILF